MLTQKYGKLEGWKWAGLVAVGGAVGWYVIRARKAAAATAAATAADAANAAPGSSAYGAPGAYNAPYPGQGEFMAKVLDQLGAISKNTTPPVVPKKPTSKPKAGYAWTLVNGVWRQVHYASQDPKPKPKPKPKPAPIAIAHPIPRLVPAGTPAPKGSVRVPYPVQAA